MAVYPGAIPTSYTAVGGETLATMAGIGHAALSNIQNAEIIAIATKLGTGASTATAGTVLRGTGAGTSGWGQVALSTDITGTLPVANGGTGATSLTGLTLPSAILANPAISGTVSGGATYTSPTLTTPTISDFTNAVHNHENNAGGGQLGTNALEDGAVTTSKITDGDVTSEKLGVAIAARAYRNGAFTVGAEADIVFDTENFDIGGDFNTTTGEFTAPITGYYHVDANLSITNIGDGEQVILRVYLNATAVALATGVGSAAGSDPRINVSDIIFAQAGDLILATSNCGASVTGGVGSSLTYIAIHFIGS